MRDKLFTDLDRAESEVVVAQREVVGIHNSRNNYNYQVSVPYEHKFTVSWGILKTNWVWNTEIRYRNETRFDQGRFDNDLVNANQKLQQAQQKLNSAEKTVKQEISSAQNQINYCNSLENEVSCLTSRNLAMQIQFPHLHLNSWNLSSQLSHIKQRKDNLINQKAKATQDLRELPEKISQTNNDGINKKAQVGNMTQQQKQASAAETRSYQQLYQKLMSLNEIDRAILAYEIILAGNDIIMSVLEKCGFFIEKTAQMAVCKNQQQVFNHCTAKGVKFDCLISEQETLALSIIKGGNNFFINKLFSSNCEFALTTFMACVGNNFNALEILLQHDQEALHKFKDVEGCGFSLLQYAVASNNIALIDFIANHDLSCFGESLVGYTSYFQMALTYNSPEVIKIIGQNSDVHQEILNLIRTNQVDMFDRAIENVDLLQEEVLSIMKSCVENGCSSMTEVIIQKIIDIRQVFLTAVSENNIELATTLISLKPDALSFEYINSLISNSQDESISLFLTQYLPAELEEIEPQMIGQNDYEIQNDRP